MWRRVLQERVHGKNRKVSSAPKKLFPKISLKMTLTGKAQIVSGKKNFPAVTEKEGGISMRQDSRKTTADMITMEEYLKKRQAIKKQQDTVRTDRLRGADALRLAELLYV